MWWASGFRFQPLRTNRIRIKPLRTNRIRIKPLKTNRNPDLWFFFKTGSGSRHLCLENFPSILWWFSIRNYCLFHFLKPAEPDSDPDQKKFETGSGSREIENRTRIQRNLKTGSDRSETLVIEVLQSRLNNSFSRQISYERRWGKDFVGHPVRSQESNRHN